MSTAAALTALRAMYPLAAAYNIVRRLQTPGGLPVPSEKVCLLPIPPWKGQGLTFGASTAHVLGVTQLVDAATGGVLVEVRCESELPETRADAERDGWKPRVLTSGNAACDAHTEESTP